MHPELEELLGLLDGSSGVGVEGHAASCPECRAEIARLRSLREAMRAAPEESPHRDLWPFVKAKIEASRRPPWAAWAAAAALLLAACLAILVLKERRAQTAPAPGQAAPADQSLAALVRESQALEDAIRLLERECKVQSGWQASAIAALEDRISLVDASLSSGGEHTGEKDQQALWRERVSLLGTLAEIHSGGGGSAEI